MLRLAILLSVFILTTAELLARAGGGDGFSSGGGGGGSFFGGGSGGDGGFIYLLFYLCIRYPALGIPLAIAVITFIIIGGNKANTARQNSVIRKVVRNQSEGDLDGNEKTIITTDPEFSREKLVQRAEEAFLKIQKAWKNRDMKEVANFISDSVRERFSTLLEIQKTSGIRNCTENVKIISAELIALECDKFFNTAHVRIIASAVDYYIETERSKTVRGNTEEHPFSEIWTFLRRPGAKTRSSGTIENFCPNCGTPLKISDSTVCTTCKAVVNSGEYDWVLSAISQEYEWNYKSRGDVPGLNELIEKDPAFNPAHIEDRASAIFYRYIAARFFADQGYIARLADSDFLKARADEFQNLPDERRRFPADTALGTVELIEAVSSESGDGPDMLRVKVKWSGHYIERKMPSLLVPDFESCSLYSHELIFIRNPGVLSNAATALSSIHCPNCGAPDTKGKSPRCEYCAALLNDGSRDWTLHDIVPFVGMTHQAFGSSKAGESPSPLVEAARMLRGDRETLVTYCAAMMKTDNEISASEMKELKKIAMEAGIPEQRLISIINSIDNNTFSIEMPQDRQTAYALLRSMVIMCLLDGKISSGEKALLEKAAANAGYSDMDVEQIVRKERLALLKMAKNKNTLAA
ncbi:MAG: hypothetical protein A2020_09580 [Lentisphaerae bacterium GWF2_45_14]|nr:MAG: hypothetical protein A2020_09580 [Lentisphaerae bacterium GWF2_45_14]